MQVNLKTTFLLLVLVQGLHSIEEYLGRLWENLPPATVLCNLVSENPATGFLIINIGLFVFGLLGWLFAVRNGTSLAPPIIWFWIIIEIINGIGHPAWSLFQGAYTPGVFTAPFLLILAIFLLSLKTR
jgi:hypothetical protein